MLTAQQQHRKQTPTIDKVTERLFVEGVEYHVNDLEHNGYRLHTYHEEQNLWVYRNPQTNTEVRFEVDGCYFTVINYNPIRRIE